MIKFLLVLVICEITPLFTPGDDIQGEIVKNIHSAKESIVIQAYGLTNDHIADALIQAHRRQVRILVILDNTSANWVGSDAKALQAEGIIVRIDKKHAIAHNKIIIIDAPLNNNWDQDRGFTKRSWHQVKVITGSFNFSGSAQKRNSENIVIIENKPEIAQKYFENWMKCWEHTEHYVPKPKPKSPTTRRRR